MSIACTSCGGGLSTIPLVPMGRFRDFFAARKKALSTPLVNEAFIGPLVAFRATGAFLRTPTGQKAMTSLLRAIGMQNAVKFIPTPDATQEMMEAIDAFLRRQRQERKRGQPPKGVAVPVPRRPGANRPAAKTGPNIQEALRVLLTPVKHPTGKKTDEDRDRGFTTWFERRWHKSPGLAFALGMDKRGFPEGNTIKPRSRKRAGARKR